MHNLSIMALSVGLVGFFAVPKATSIMNGAQVSKGEVTSFAKWKVSPSPDMLRRYFKKAHVNPHKAGYADVSCVSVQPDRLVDCVEISQTPGTDYARALILASHEFRVVPPSVNGVPQFGSKLRVHFFFDAHQ